MIMDANELYKKYSANYMGEGDNKRLENYHQYRISSFTDLFRRNFSDNSQVIDYGCGDGVLKKNLGTERYIGIDPSDEMIHLAHLIFPDSKQEFLQGGLKELRSACLNTPPLLRARTVLICLNTLPYMSNDEVDEFFSIAQEYQLPVIVSHTNELLDLVSYNRYTIEHRRNILSDEDLEIYQQQFNEMLSYPDRPPKVSQVNVRFGDSNINTSERDTITKFRVDPFKWPNAIAKKYGYNIQEVQPIRIFAFPPAVMERDEQSLALLHSDRFDPLPDTYKKIFCSQFRVVFIPK